MAESGKSASGTAGSGKVDPERMLEVFAGVFRKAGEIETIPIASIEGHQEQGELSLKVLMATEDFVMLWAERGAGLIDPPHQHDDHESVAMLLKGRMRMHIGGEEFEVGPGDVWRHPPGVVHGSEALEPCIQIEIKSPPRRTWNL
jgi:mannose-6-phosphate isomerase-like protein (cupin superfamily)